MAGLNFQADPVSLAAGDPAAGTQFASRPAGPIQTRPETYRMVTKLALVAAAVLLVTPAAVTVMLPERQDSAAARSVELSDPILSFTQMGDRIQIRLRPAANEVERDARRQVTVRTAKGETTSIPLKAGQTWASTELTGDMADADELIISVD